jgi:Tol biopolymer transport system component
VLGKPEIWIGYGPDGVRTIDLRPAGIKTVTDMTWTSETQLLISGSRKAGDAAGYSDRLYTVDVATGAVASFRNLIGTEPSASPDSGKIVYVKFRKLDNGPKNNGQAPKYRESLMLATLTGTGSSQTLDSDEYRLTADYHAFADPQIAPGGAWIAYGTTGSDVSVTYTVICLGDEYYVPWLKMWMPTPLAMAWAPAGPLLALGGAAVGPEEDQDAGMYVMDAAGGTTDRTTRDLFTKDSIEWVMDMDWSLDGKIVADGMPKDFDATEEFRVLLIDGHDLTRLTDLGEGHLSVWVK